MTPRLRLGLVGCGRLAERCWGPAIASVDGVALAAVADPSLDRCARVAPSAAVFPSAGELVASGSVDALIVASPVAYHLEHARLAAGAGLAALVEKPPGPDARTAEALAALEPPPWIGFNRRFDPALAPVAAAARAVEAPGLLLELRYRRSVWNPYEVGDDVLLDLGPHLVDLARWVSGREVEGLEGSLVGPRRAALELRLEGGATARIACACDRAHIERVEVRHAGKRIARAVHGGVLRNAAARIRPPAEPALAVTFRRELEAFAAAARGGSAGSLATARDGIAAMHVLDAARLAG